MPYTIALAGNPNSGKTTVFNTLTGSRQHVGNWPGVTVDKKEGVYRKDRQMNIVDLPGTYSLSPYSAEEVIAHDFIVKQRPDCVIDIIDGTSLERNLYLALQIMETGVPTVLGINMMDEVALRNDHIDFKRLEAEFGVEVVPLEARSGKGIDALMEAVKRTIEGNRLPKRLAVYDLATKVDEDTLADKRYSCITEVVQASVRHGSKTGPAHISITDRIDRVLTHKIWALPAFAFIMYFMFAATFSENFLFVKGLPSPGIALASLVETLWGSLTDVVSTLLSSAGAADWAYSLIISGIMEGLGAVLGFLPLILVLYVLMSFLEDSGYMARVAFVMDRLFRKFGLSGRSFIPLLMGFGCSVPAIMATRTLDNEKDRRITTLLCGFMPCGAKLTIFIMFVSTFFSSGNKTLVLFFIYMLSLSVSVVVSLLINKIAYKGETSNFLMELPQYRLPTLRSVGIHGYEKVKGFIQKAGTVILAATILIWALSNFNFSSFNGNNQRQYGTPLAPIESSFLASVGKAVAPIFIPAGFGEWRPTVGIATGWIAKEMVVVTLAQLYAEDINETYLAQYFADASPDELSEYGFEDGIYDSEAASDIYTEAVLMTGGDAHGLPTLKEDIPTRQAALAYMAFNLLCMPCFAAVGAMRRELKSWRRTFGQVGIQMLTAYIVAVAIHMLGNLLF
ncbi:ferrous iron transport protein B [Sphaerochaeta sp. PS]|uniref:ferrous iron transport protein B n=1 Tax=Sphaerochaeta sp. PS TaxID=3076336 RepID=UPI0028A3098D|nr:ferrous iron transport protein B [Sphaerochaeta sp. PS]MDT4762471.1 ferrous iron transport protein B [Sphaerochaeta sp. PS]